MRKFIDRMLKNGLVLYLENVIDAVEGHVIEFEDYEIGLLKVDFDGEKLYKENGHYYYLDASLCLYELDEMEIPDLLALIRDAYYQPLSY